MRRLGLVFALWSRFKREGRMVWAMWRNPATPAAAKLVSLLALAYLVSPIDLVSDLIPFAGWVDDGVVVAALLALAYKLLPKDLYDSLRRRTEQATAAPIEGEARRVG
jgi:uncharacterized membrane protein YkvA (DUF1232 family)